MRDENDGPPLKLMDTHHFLLQRLAGNRVERTEWFVHEQHFRIGRQRTRHADALLLSAGKLVRIAPTKLRRIKAEQRK